MGAAIMPWHMCRGQEGILWGQFSPFTFMWDLEIERRSQACVASISTS